MLNSQTTLTLVVVVLLSMLLTSADARADAMDDFIEGSGTLGKFGIDVLQDFTLEGQSSEETGKARLKSFLKDKFLGDIKKQLTGGDDISAGMGLILNRIHDAVGAMSRTRGGRQGMCQQAALGLAWSTTFDAKNARLLRGAANVWFDLVTSAIPGAAALAEKLVLETGKAAYEATRARIESEIKKAWASQKSEDFGYERKAGPCTVKLRVLWNKKKSAYLFIISGKCECKTVGARGAALPMRGFTILGGGKAGLEVDTKDPGKPKVRVRVGSPRVRMRADCACAAATSIVEPPREKKPVQLPYTGLIESEVLQPRCDACWPKLRAVQHYVGEINDIASEMNRLRDSIQKEEYDTPGRAGEIKRWKALEGQLSKIQIMHDKAFDAFVACENSECAFGTERLRLPTYDLEREVSTVCEHCQAKVAAANARVAEVNALLKEMNSYGRITQRSEVRLGTTLGNGLYRKWQALEPKLGAARKALAAARRDLSVCEQKQCFADRYEPFSKERPVSGACKRCAELQEQYNRAVAGYNDAVDVYNAYVVEAKKFVFEHGADSTEAIDGLSALKKKHGYRQAMRTIGEFNDRAQSMLFELGQCMEKWCKGVTAEDEKEIRIGGGAPPGRPPRGDGEPDAFNPRTTLPDLSLPALPRELATGCKACASIVASYNATIANIGTLQQRLREAAVDQYNADLAFQAAVYRVSSFRLPRVEYDGSGDSAEEIRVVSEPIVEFHGKGKKASIDGMQRRRFPVGKGDSSFRAAFAQAIEQRDRAQQGLVAAARRVRELRFEHDVAWKSLTALVGRLRACERKCMTVTVRDVRVITGNNPFDPRDPLAEDSTRIGAGGDTAPPMPAGSPPGASPPAGAVPPPPVPTIQVINNIPVARLFLAGPDACPANHYHGTANNCDGVLTADPDPTVCGHGTVADVTSIPVTSCPDF